MTDTQPFMDEARAAVNLVLGYIDRWEGDRDAFEHLYSHVESALSSAYRRGREEERERCALIAETAETPDDGEYWIANRIAAAIRTERDKG